MASNSRCSFSAGSHGSAAGERPALHGQLGPQRVVQGVLPTPALHEQGEPPQGQRGVLVRPPVPARRQQARQLPHPARQARRLRVHQPRGHAVPEGVALAPGAGLGFPRFGGRFGGLADYGWVWATCVCSFS